MLSAKTFRFEMLLVSLISLLKEGFAVGCTKYAFGRTMCINLFVGVENEHISKQGCSSKNIFLLQGVFVLQKKACW